MKVSVPGNILLLGEYAVLQGGLGVAAAVGGRVRLEAEPAPSLSIEGTWTGGSFLWTPERQTESFLASAAFETVWKWRLAHGRKSRLPTSRIRIDSSELYSKAGRKAGYGSSAAVTVALVTALLADDRLDRTIPRLALAAHRSAQGGAGSGYDVYCSYFGGWGVFRGGARPAWRPLRLRFDARLYCFPGPCAVSTRDAIRSFTAWRNRDRRLAGRLLRESDGNVAAFFAASSAQKAAAAFRKARDTGIALGDAIGVDARIPSPAGVDPELCKSVGAGNELGVYLALPGAPAPPPRSGLIPVDVAEGISCKP
jgi:phosphomevalonate kinase